MNRAGEIALFVVFSASKLLLGLAALYIFYYRVFKYWVLRRYYES